MADEFRLETQYQADKKLNFLSSASLEHLQQICLQYRFFTQEFSSNLGLLISKMPPGYFKTLLGEILHEELGEGNPEKAHISLYDYFLDSIGTTKETLEISILPENAVLLEEIRGLLLSMPAAYGIGLVGMGGECLCQIYLSQMHKRLLENPFIQQNKPNLAWTFWDFHTGEADIIHRQKVRAAIGDFVDQDPMNVEYLTSGYLRAKASWDQFWANNFRIAMPKTLPVTV